MPLSLIAILLTMLLPTGKCGHIEMQSKLVSESQFRAMYERVYPDFGTPSRSHYDRTLYIAKRESNRGSKSEVKLGRTVKNPKSSAYGLFGFLTSTFKSTGFSGRTDCAECQMIGFFRYIDRRYSGSITKAYNHHKRYGWY